MKLTYKINLVALVVLGVVGLAIAAAGVATISRVIYDLNRELMSHEVDSIVATIRDAYDVLVENRLDGVESYKHQAQTDVVSELETYSYGKTGLLFIVTVDGKVVKHHVLAAGQQCDIPHVAAMAENGSGTMEFSCGRQRRFFSYKLFPQWNWLIILSVTNEEMLAARSQFVGMGAGILSISLVLGAMVFIWFIRRVVGPIRQLAEATTYVSEGKWDVILPEPAGSDEIARLAAAFRRMAARLADMYGSLEKNFRKLERSTSALRQSQERYKALYKEAKETEERYHSLIESTLDAIVIYDMDGHATYVNNAFTGMFGWRLEDIGDGVPYVPDSEREATMKQVDDITRNGLALKDIETKRLTKEGDLVDVSFTASRFNDHKGAPAGMFVILRDITQRKQAMEELRKHRDHLEELVNARTVELATAKEQAESANAAKSDFLARMSHEIRTPLNAVLGFTSVVLKSTLTVQQRESLNKARIASENLLEIINDILDFSKIEAGRLELERSPFTLEELLEPLADLFGERAEQKGLALFIYAAQGVPRVLEGDRLRLSQVLANLIDNALKFTDQGQIVLTVLLDDDAGRDPDGGSLKFQVQDSGTGIPADTIDGLFEPFVQAGGYMVRRHEGTGLGLAICRRLVELMGGKIQARSDPGQGSTFSFTIPLGRREGDKTAVDAPGEFQCLRMLSSNDGAFSRRKWPDRRLHPTAELAALRGRRVLVVEDNAFNRDVAVAFLEDAGLVVDVAENGKEAVEKVVESRQGFDAVLMDIQMPEMDGYTATREIRKREENGRRKPRGKDDKETAQHDLEEKFRDRTPIIALTAHALKGEREKCLEGGMDDYLAKPLNEEQLLRMLLKWVASPSEKSALAPQTSSCPKPQGPAEAACGLDEQSALELLGGREEIYFRMLGRFEKAFGNDYETLRRHLAEGDVETASRMAHSIKSAAASIGATALSEASAKLEEAVCGKGGDPDACLEHFGTVLREAFRAVSRRLASLDMPGAPPSPSTGETVEPPPEAALQNIARTASRGEYTLLKGILDALEHEDGKYGGFCAKIREYAAMYDDEGIARFIDSVRRKG